MDNHEATTQKDRLEKYQALTTSLEALDGAIEALTELATHAGVEFRELRFNRPATTEELENIGSNTGSSMVALRHLGKSVIIHVTSISVPADALIKALLLVLKRRSVDIEHERETL